MAEGFLRHLAPDRFDVASAGTEQTEVRPEAIDAMKKHGVDISTHSSKTFDRFLNDRWDFVITVCDQANETCPAFPNAQHRLHWSFPDPSQIKGAERQAAFDRVAAQIEERVRRWLAGVET